MRHSVVWSRIVCVSAFALRLLSVSSIAVSSKIAPEGAAENVGKVVGPLYLVSEREKQLRGCSFRSYRLPVLVVKRVGDGKGFLFAWLVNVFSDWLAC